MTEIQHEDVAAYALGLLGDDERAAFERHLDGCASCAGEVGTFVAMGELIKTVHPDDLLPHPPDAQVESLLVRRAAAERRRRRFHRTFMTAAACLVVAAGVFLAVGSFTNSGPNPDSIHGPARDLLLTGRTQSFSDAATGVSGVVGLEDKGWGTHVALELKGVKGPLQCRLKAVGDDGRSEVVASWGVPDKGYGVPGSPDPLVLHGGTSLPQSDLNHFTVETFDGRSLATIAV